MKAMDVPTSPLPEDDWLEQALRRQGHRLPAWLADDGFSDQVMRRLPPARQRRHARWWPVIGAWLGALTLLCTDQHWRVLLALFLRLEHPGVVLAILLMLMPAMLTSMALLLLTPNGD